MDNNTFSFKYNEIETRAYMASCGIKQHGISSLEHDIDQEKFDRKENFELALKLVCDGIDRAIVEKFLDSAIDFQLDPNTKLLRQIEKEAVLGIMDGTNPGDLVMKLNSYVDFGKENAQAIYQMELKNSQKPPEEIKKQNEELARLSARDEAENDGIFSQEYINALLKAVNEEEENQK